MLIGPTMAFGLAKMLYKNFLRDLVKNAVEDSATPWDDLALSMADAIFGYDENEPPDEMPEINP